MKRYKAIITDIDGTLTPIIPHSLPSKRVTESIRKAQSKGYSISLASGRPFPLVQYITKHLGSVGPCIVDNGAVIADSANGDVLWEALLDQSTAEYIRKMIEHYPLFRISTDHGALGNPLSIPKYTKIRKLSLHDITPNEADKIIQNVEKTMKNVSVVKASSYKSDQHIDLYFCNIGATKQHAVLKLAEILNISTHEMIGVGDGYNDFPLLMACGLKVAMGNAVEELKAIADKIAPSVEDDGLAYIIDKYLLE